MVTHWIEAEFDRADASAKPTPGRVTARRLNRAEYNNTIRDLLGVEFRPANDFPQDDSGYGFDNIGYALSLSPVLMEKYLAAAEQAVRVAIFGPEKTKPTVVRHQPSSPYREGTDGGDNSRFLAALPYSVTDYDLTGLTLPSALHTIHTFPAEGDYEFRIDPEGNRPRPSKPFDVAIWIDGKQVKTIPFEASTAPTGMERFDKTAMVHAPAGEHWVAAVSAPDIPAIDEGAVGASMSLRQHMEKHRSNAICSSCHARMDPIGFGLENFDAICRWRTQDGKFPIDASGKLPERKIVQ